MTSSVLKNARGSMGVMPLLDVIKSHSDRAIVVCGLLGRRASQFALKTATSASNSYVSNGENRERD